MSASDCHLQQHRSCVQAIIFRGSIGTMRHTDRQPRATCRLVHKQYRDYDEAVKCYKNALRMDKESQQVLRDLAALQVRAGLLLCTPLNTLVSSWQT